MKKDIKRDILTSLFALVIAGACIPAVAQKGHFTDNMFAEIGGGINTIIDNGYRGEISPAVEVAVGKWVAPGVAIRVGWHGLSNRTQDSSVGWFAGEDAFGFNYGHLDWVFDPVQAFNYKANRRLSVAPYATAGVIVTSYGGRSNSEFGAGAGINASVRIAGRFGITADARVLLAREEAFRQAGEIIAFPSVTAGVTYAIGHQEFRRKEATKELVFVPCEHEDSLNALRKELDLLRNRKPEIVHDTVAVKEFLAVGNVVYFNLDKDFVSKREEAHIEYLINLLDCVDCTWSIVGHADKETGNPAHNLNLSHRRVENVKKVMMSLGISEKDIVTDYKGDTANFANTSPKNRCVTISVTIND